MLKIIDVEYVSDFLLELSFSDGYLGQADLAAFFKSAPFSSVANFKKFSLTTEGSLSWNGNELSAQTLRALAIGVTVEYSPVVNVNEMEAVIKQATWDSMLEGRPDILQAAIRAYVEQFGHSQVIAKAGISSRTSAYRSLKPQTTPNFGTLVQLGHAVIELATEGSNKAYKAMSSGAGANSITEP